MENSGVVHMLKTGKVEGELQVHVHVHVCIDVYMYMYMYDMLSRCHSVEYFFIVHHYCCNCLILWSSSVVFTV